MASNIETWDRRNILRLREFILASKHTFNMRLGICFPSELRGGCIGCHAARLWPSLRTATSRPTLRVNPLTKKIIGVSYSWLAHALMIKLGIDYDTHQRLCFPGSDGMAATKRGAGKMLRTLAKTGRVEW